MPYDNVARKHYDSGDYPRALRMAREKLDVDKWRERQQRGEPDGRLIGIGFASYCEQSAHGTSVFSAWGLPMTPGYDQAQVRLTAGGGLEVRIGVQSHGQGMETTMAQIAHQVLGIDVARVQVIHGDTGNTPFSTGTYASRSIVMSGGAVANACKELIPRFVRIGAFLLKAPEADCKFEGGAVVAANGGKATLADIAEAWYMRPERLPDNVDRQGLEASVAFKPKRDTGAFSYASHAVAVAVDMETGQVEILDYVVVEDCGTLVNPAVVEHQAIGGIAQGIGTAMYEEQQYDANGQPNASTLADYLIPGPTEIPNIRIFHMESPSPYTEFGIKGMGEGGAIAPPAVIFNAVNNALDPYGVEVRDTPLTPEKLLAAIEAAKAVPKREAA
jgi:carbon-monoxide dehydrogenase large subunit